MARHTTHIAASCLGCQLRLEVAGAFGPSSISELLFPRSQSRYFGRTPQRSVIRSASELPKLHLAAAWPIAALISAIYEWAANRSQLESGPESGLSPQLRARFAPALICRLCQFDGPSPCKSCV